MTRSTIAIKRSPYMSPPAKVMCPCALMGIATSPIRSSLASIGMLSIG
jgi:hypothetical protein